MISKLIEMRNYERYIYKKYIKNDKYPPISLQIKIVRFQRAYYNLRLFLYIFPFLNLTFNLIILWRHSYYNEALLISVIPIIIISILTFYSNSHSSQTLYPKGVLDIFKANIRWHYYFHSF